MKALLASSLCFYAVVLLCASALSTQSVEKKQIYVPPPQFISHLHFGYSEVMADSLWIRSIQDFDYCGNDAGLAKDLILPESQILAKETQEKAGELQEEFAHLIREITLQNRDQKVCKKGWVWQMLDGVTELAPQFKSAYIYGATSLSVVLNDYEGASHLFEKGVNQFPDDWRLPYHAAYHFMFDRQDLNRAARLLDIAVKKGAPQWVSSLAARAYTATGQGELAIRNLLAFREHTTGELRRQVDQRIERIHQTLLKSKEK